MKSMRILLWLSGPLFVSLLGSSWSFGQPGAGRYVPVDSGPTISRLDATAIAIGNRAFMATWSIAAGRLKSESFEDTLSRHGVPVPDEAFVLTLADGRVINASEMKLTGPARQETLDANTVGSVLGVVPADQIRRGFLHYIERERAHPYRTFLHYNTWWDYLSKIDEKVSLDVIERYGRELVRMRGVTLDSFLLDDGWDVSRAQPVV